MIPFVIQGFCSTLSPFLETVFDGACLSRPLLKRWRKISKPKFALLFWVAYNQSMFWISHINSISGNYLSFLPFYCSLPPWKPKKSEFWKNEKKKNKQTPGRIAILQLTNLLELLLINHTLSERRNIFVSWWLKLSRVLVVLQFARKLISSWNDNQKYFHLIKSCVMFPLSHWKL